ncbi:universal stress protein [Cupriavidus sp. L7L]|uniref:universal stress protein n=1 Tax=Cupriavidus sp. L7L TaxID=2546443 RepID=UPI0010567400|nr:universal stress protein [Cupriavidus sp. L7L]TDF67236.1 universal stress protein [Cupriavidus sp. L7L]
MDYATIMVHLDASRHVHQRLHLATQLALEFNAALVGLLAAGNPDPKAIRYFADGDRYLASYKEWHRQIEDCGRQAFEGATKGTGITTEWRAPECATVSSVQADVHLADLLILGQRDSADAEAFAEDHFVESVVLHCGRPVLLVPYAGRFSSVGKNILVAWNGSREAARAIRDALPLLLRADHVHIVSYLRPGILRDPWLSPVEHAVQWLARHGVQATHEEPVLNGGGDDAGKLLLSLAADRDADLIVMGAYGHARLREIVLGGMTRTLLESMTVPVLMSH